jgi:hypothetical protein
MRNARLTTLVVALLTTILVSTSACSFSEQDHEREAGPFTPQFTGGQAPATTTPPPPTSRDKGPCADPDNTVIITCLASTAAVYPGPSAQDAFVAERTTGKVLSTLPGTWKLLTLAQFDVDASGDGGLMDFAFSPTYDQDHLIYAYITTPSDNRIVRIAPGDVAKPILTGIPKGPTGNLGSMMFVGDQLVVATGDAGNPGAANDPGSLAGKLLVLGSINVGSPAPPRVLVSGLGESPAMCPDAESENFYLSDQAVGGDRLQQIPLHADTASGNVTVTGPPKVLWTWPDQPGVAGCAAAGGTVMVSETKTQRIESLVPPTDKNPTMEAPKVVLEKRFGALGRGAAGKAGFVFATVNKQYGKPGKTDDRVFIIPPSAGHAEDRD